MNVKIKVFPPEDSPIHESYTIVFDADEVRHGRLPDYLLDETEMPQHDEVLGMEFGSSKEFREKTLLERGYIHYMDLTRSGETKRYLLQFVEVFITNEVGKTVDMFDTL